MDKIKRMKELIHDLNRASDSYYGSGTTLMSDAEFDSKLLELKQLEEEANTVFPNSPVNRVGGAVLKSLIKVKHETPMLSLDKCHSVEEIKKFAAGHDIVASIKLDGISCRLIYQDGELIGAESRGNGTEGNDILQHVKQFMNVPLRINKKGKYVIDGEALIKLDDFEEINKNGEYKNSRNLTAGTLSSLDTSVVKDRKLSWYAWEVVEEVDPILAISNNDYEAHDSFYFRLLEAGKLGFSIVPCEVLGLKYYQNEELQCKIDNFISLAAEKHLPQDGVVFKFEDVEYGKSLGSTEHHNRNGIAFKVKNDSVETTLKDIEFTMGKTGILTPTAVFEPVETEGSTVERASLHNISVMRELMPRPFRGQRIGVFKANLIIPQLRWAEKFISDGFEKDMEKSFIHIVYWNKRRAIKFKDRYGVIKNVSDKEFFTNSMHVPVWEKVNPFEKIDIESQLTGYSSAGCITYVELESTVDHNLEALEDIVNYAMDHDVPYFAVNVPNDMCTNCGYTGEIGNECPVCGCTNIRRLRRVTGYLTGDYKTAFNVGKQQEVELRTKHSGTKKEL